MTDQLTLHRNLPAMIAAYEHTKALLVDGFATVQRARDTWDAVFKLADCSRASLVVRASSCTHYEVREVDGALADLRRQTWSNIVDRMGLVNIMSPERFRALEERIKRDSLGEPSVEVVQRFVANHMHDLPSIFEENVRFVFEMLRPRPRGTDENNRFKRNSQEEIPASIVLSERVQQGFMDPNGPFSLRIWRKSDEEEFLTLERVFRALDGKGEIARSWKSDIGQAIKLTSPKNKSGETEYFKFTCHKNGNLHLTFKRLDLLAKLNEIGGGNRLRKTKSRGADIVRERSNHADG